jgi:hypothetical protein
MDITGLSGVTEAQRRAMLALGAVDHGQRLRPEENVPWDSRADVFSAVSFG